MFLLILRNFLLNLSGALLFYFISFLSVGEDFLEYGSSLLLFPTIEKL